MNHYLKKICLGIWAGLVVGPSFLFSQIAGNDSAWVVTIGELEGRFAPGALLSNPMPPFYFLNNMPANTPGDFRQTDTKNIVFRTKNSINPSFPAGRRIQYQFFESEWSLIAALITQKIDFARLISEESAREIAKSNRMIHVLPELLPNHTVTLLSFNCRHSHWGRTEVRQALSYAIDKSGIVDQLLKKRADLARGPFNREFEAYESSLEEFRYNPKKAIELLQAGGWHDYNNDGILEDRNGNPLKIELLYRQGLVLDEQLVRWIKINWNQIGVDVKPRPVLFAQLQTLLNSGQFDVVLMEHQFEESVESLEAFFSVQTASGFSGYSSSRLHNYFRLYHRIEDPVRRKILIQSIQKVINQEQPVIFLYFKWLMFNFINRNRIENYLDSAGNLRPVPAWQIKTN